MQIAWTVEPRSRAMLLMENSRSTVYWQVSVELIPTIPTIWSDTSDSDLIVVLIVSLIPSSLYIWSSDFDLQMTRWARATAPSEKKYEESTPWEQMQKGVKEKKKKAEKKNADETKKAKKKKKVKTSKDPSTASTESNDFERKHSELKKNLGLEPGGLAAELEKLKNENPGIDQNEEDEIRTMIKKEERRENRRLKRIKERDSHKACFNTLDKVLLCSLGLLCFWFL